MRKANILACFKDYDIRGKAPAVLNAAFAQALGAAIASVLTPRRVVIGRDARLTSPLLAAALAESLAAQGVEVVDTGLCGTEEIYFAVQKQAFDAGVMITGSHNPADENGFKIVRAGAVPVGADSGLRELAVATCALLNDPAPVVGAAKISTCDFRAEYMDWLLAQAPLPRAGRSLRIVADAGNGCAGPFLRALAPRLAHEIIVLNREPDGHFPNGVPNPLLPERRATTQAAVVARKADFGVAFDGDFDRCFFFDEQGEMVESCYLIGQLARELLTRQPRGARVIHDARVYWLTREMVAEAGGVPIMSRGGHTRMKESMRRENAVYGAEMSAHHFYRDFAFCDSGMLTFLLALSLVARQQQSLCELVAQGREKYPCSGEINFRVDDARAQLERLWQKYAPAATKADRMDGINLEFPLWRFNLRASNTEPLLRLNVEARGDLALLQEKTAELERLISV